MSEEMITVRVRALDLARFGLEMDRAAEDVRKPGKAAKDSEGDFTGLLKKIDVLGAISKSIRPAAIIAGVGAAAGAVSSLASGAIALTSSLGPAAGVLAAYPALGLAGAQGLGVFKLATTDVFKAVGGLNSKLEENSSAFKKLSPEGQSFARVLEGLKAPFRELPVIAQKAMLPGFVAGLKSASQNIQIFIPLVRATAGALGGFARQAGALVGSKGFGNDLHTIGMRNVSWMRQAGSVALNLVDALRHLLIAAGPLVDWLVKLAVGWSHTIDAQARAGRESGRLAGFFDRTRAVLSRLISIGSSFVHVLLNVGHAAMPLGNELLAIIDKNTKAFARWTGSATGQNAIARFFAQAKPPLMEAGRLIRDLVVDFFKLGSGNQGGLTQMLHTIRTQLLPAFFQITQSTTKAFGPQFVKTVTDFVRAFQPLLGSSGPLLVYLKILDGFAKMTSWITHNVPGAGTALSILGNSIILLKAMGMAGFTSQLFGFKRGLGLVKSGLQDLRGAADTAKLGMEAMRLAFIANGGAADASNLSVLRAAAAAKLSALWSKVCAAATRIWAAAQAALDAVMEANPIVLVVTAIVALGAAIFLAYKKVGWFRNAVNAAFRFVRNIVGTVVGFVGRHWSLLLAILTGPFGLAARFIIQHFDQIIGFISGLPGKIAKAASGMWNGLKEAFREAIDWIIKGWNSLHFHVPGIKLPVIGTVGGFDLGVPQIPLLAQGGVAAAGGLALTGDAGPEIINLPRGASVHPLGARNGDDLAEKIAGAIARRMPDRPLQVHLWGEQVGHGVLRWLDDQAVGV